MVLLGHGHVSAPDRYETDRHPSSCCELGQPVIGFTVLMICWGSISSGGEILR